MPELAPGRVMTSARQLEVVEIGAVHGPGIEEVRALAMARRSGRQRP